MLKIVLINHQKKFQLNGVKNVINPMFSLIWLKLSVSILNVHGLKDKLLLMNGVKNALIEICLLIPKVLNAFLLIVLLLLRKVNLLKTGVLIVEVNYLKMMTLRDVLSKIVMLNLRLVNTTMIGANNAKVKLMFQTKIKIIALKSLVLVLTTVTVMVMEMVLK